MHPNDQTIFALSSGRPPSAIAIVRVSGPQSGLALKSLAGKVPAPRQATRALLRDARAHPIDDAVVLWFSPDNLAGNRKNKVGGVTPVGLFSVFARAATIFATQRERGRGEKRGKLFGPLRL
jgi:tRNA modification GTPase